MISISLCRKLFLHKSSVMIICRWPVMNYQLVRVPRWLITIQRSSKQRLEMQDAHLNDSLGILIAQFHRARPSSSVIREIRA